MRSSEPSDPELLAEWLDHQREPAFRALVARYAGLVRMTAKRTCGDDSMATEATQLTFITLAQKAKSLTTCTTLGGWLHRTAMMQAKNLARKSERENRKLEQLAMEPHTPSHDETWREIQPVLDDALAALSDKDREALLLRFYRSLTIRVIAATLGIATDAAQKRIDRATERLRGKLMRRGVQTGGSLSAAMLAGFAVDAQAALPVSVFASNAVAAGALHSGAISTATILMTATKSSVPFAIILIGLFTWVAIQRKSIASIEQEVASIRAGLAEREADDGTMNPARRISRPAKAFDVDRPINWKEVEAYWSDPKRDPRWIVKLEAKLASMTPEELIAEMDKIAALFPSESRMEQMVLRPLIGKDPELPLRHLFGRLDGWTSSLSIPLIHAMQEWARRDIAKATAWFDEQAAAGTLNGKQLNDRSLMDRFHGAIIGVMISQDSEAAAMRFAMVPEKDRNSFVSMNISYWAEEVHDYAAYASIVREMIPEKDRLWPIAAFAEAIGYEKVGDFLEAIDATPAERAQSVGSAAEVRVQNLSAEEKITRSDIDAIREWAGRIAPHAVGRVTGTALARATNINTTLTFDEAAELALEYHTETKDDDVLVGFLDSYAGYSNVAAGRIVANRIIDPERRNNLQHNSPQR